MSLPHGVLLIGWTIYIVHFTICFNELRIVVSQVLINTTSEVIACSVVVALLCTCHDVDIMNTELVCIFSKSFSFDAIFVLMVSAIISKIVVREGILGDIFCLFTVCVLSTYGSMQMQVFETMNLVVNLKI